jgi:hypothetical protein
VKNSPAVTALFYLGLVASALLLVMLRRIVKKRLPGIG